MSNICYKNFWRRSCESKNFFVKHYKEYINNVGKFFKTLGLNFDAITDFQMPYQTYRDIVVNQHKPYNENLAELHEGKLYGDIPIIDRANMLYYADFFIGLGSGLSWLANAVGCPVIMIAGFSIDFHEFFTPYRVANRFVCNGCYNDIRATFLNNKTCQQYSGTDRELECQKKISPHQVIQAIDNLIADKNLKTFAKSK